MRAYYSDTFRLPLPERHFFPMEKYELLRERVLHDGVLAADDLLLPEAATDGELFLAHDPVYVQRVTDGLLTHDEQRRIGFPWSRALVERSRRSVGATIGACRAALEDGVAANLAGGTHHAFSDRGEGYCVFNDAAVAVRVLQREGRVRRALVLDCDVHQGNGTAAIFAHDPTVFTCSIHGERNFPKAKEHSDLDVALPDGTGNEAYLEALAAALGEAFARARPDLVVYLAGADPLASDRLGRLALCKEGLAERDARVLHACRSHGTPVALAMAGGYAKDVRDTVDVHARTLALAAAVCSGSRPRRDARADADGDAGAPP